MPRIRSLKPDFWTDEKIVQLPYEFRLLFIGLWNLADDRGRLLNRPEKIKYQLFPADDIDVAMGLKYLDALNLIHLYSAADEDFIQITNFEKHQKISHLVESKFPPNTKKAILGEERRQLALRYGCEPGKEKEVTCYFCGKKGMIRWPQIRGGMPSSYVIFSLEIDHLIPEANGGNQNKNLILSCMNCNRSRGNKDMLPFLEHTGKLQKLPETSRNLQNNSAGVGGGEGNGNGKRNRKKGALPPDPRVSEVMKELEGLRGYPSPRPAAESKAVKDMLKLHTQELILACWKVLKAEPFWDGKELFMMTIKAQIGAWKAKPRGRVPQKYAPGD